MSSQAEDAIRWPRKKPSRKSNAEKSLMDEAADCMNNADAVLAQFEVAVA